VAHNKETGDNVGPLILSAEKASHADAAPASEEKTTALGKIKKVLGFGSDKNTDGLTTRERLAKMGLSALLSYGWVSNMSYAVMLSLSWYGFSKKVSICIVGASCFHNPQCKSDDILLFLTLLLLLVRLVSLLWHLGNGNHF
jgi:hypothetical protein